MIAPASWPPLVAGAHLRWARDIYGRPPAPEIVQRHAEDCALLARLGWEMDDVLHAARRVDVEGACWTIIVDIEGRYLVSRVHAEEATKYWHADSFEAALALTPWPRATVEETP